MVSIIVPAHDEEAVIAGLLTALAPGIESDEYDVIVVCNACSDRTADVARGFTGVKVIETEIASKTNALNLGDDVATRFPRFYVDADIVLTPETIRQVAARLDAGDALLAAPVPRVDLAGSSWLVRAFYAAWQRTPYYRAGFVGCGVYAMSATGRARFGPFPDLIADDGYVRALFSPAERASVPEVTVVVRAPRTFSDLVRVKTRSRLGVLELQQRFPDIGQKDDSEKSRGGTLATLLADPLHLPSTLVYLAVKLIVNRRARRQLAERAAGSYRWERDLSTRTG
jgi:glycosyltransferase involved in cell wall biosynthesis